MYDRMLPGLRIKKARASELKIMYFYSWHDINTNLISYENENCCY